MHILADPVTSPFNNWLKANGVYVAIAVAILLLLIVGIVFLLSKNRR